MALDFLAGCLGGCAGILVGHPLDTIKVHLQTQDFRNPVYRGTYHCFQTILQKESVGGLYRGMSSPMAGVALINAIVFGVYGNIQRRLDDPDLLPSLFLAGFTAGLAQSFVSSPMELAKTRLQVQRGHVYRSCVHCILQIARTEGVRGVYRGFGVTMLRDAPAMGIYFLCYELMTRTTSADPISTTHVMVAGGLAGSISWASTFPFDVLKSRLQVDGMYGSAKYSGALDCFRQSVRSEGLSFVVRGLSSTLIRAFPVNAATFAAVTWVFRLAGVGSSENESGHYVVGDIQEERSNIKLYHAWSGEDVWKPRRAELWQIWEDKGLKGLFHWRKMIMHNTEGIFFVGHQHKSLPTKFMKDEPPQPQLKSTVLPSNSMLLGSSNSEDSDLEDDIGAEFNIGEPILCTQHECSQEQAISLIRHMEDNEGTADKDTLNEKYRTSKQENG